MQLQRLAPATAASPTARMPPGASPPLDLANPALDAVLDAQARFRVSGSGPLAQRAVTAATGGARELLEQSPAATTDAVRGVLRLVEDAAGGPAASRALRFDGVAFADSPAGLRALTWRARMDGDEPLKQAYRTGNAADRAYVLEETTRLAADAAAVQANTGHGWVNLGPSVAIPYLRAKGVALDAGTPTTSARDTAMSVRILRHEAEHAADATVPQLSPDAAWGMRELTAELHSRSLPDLQRARRLLGLDGVVADADLAVVRSDTPYGAIERAFLPLLRASGVDPASAAGKPALSGGARDVTEALVAAAAARTGQSAAQVRAGFDAAMADAVAGSR